MIEIVGTKREADEVPAGAAISRGRGRLVLILVTDRATERDRGDSL